MSFSPIPKYSFRKIEDVTPGILAQLGVRFLMLDLDNTIARYGDKSPPDKIARWARELKNAGTELFIVSNSRVRGRAETFAESLNIGYIKAAKKPSPKGVLRALELAGYDKNSAALAGDQIFTDTLAANRAGIISIVVPPVSIKNPLFALRYLLELPFRALCRNKKGAL